MWGISVWATAVILLLSHYVSADDNFSPSVKSTKPESSIKFLSYFDDSSNVIALHEKSAIFSTDDGVTWNTIKEFDDQKVSNVIFDPYVKTRAFAFSRKGTHFVTEDKGKSWRKFETKDKSLGSSYEWKYPSVSFNVADQNLILLDYQVCHTIFSSKCSSSHFYTKDGFKTNPKILLSDASTCKFARSNPDFDSSVKAETIVCSKEKTNSFGHVLESSVLKSTDFFKTLQKIEHPRFGNGRIIDLRVDSAFLLVVVQKDKYNQKSEVSLVVSKDAQTFEESNLDFEVNYGALIFLDSNPLSLFLSVAKGIGRGSRGEATIYSSDSTGLRFKELLDGVMVGATTKVENVDGVWYANVLSKELQSGFDSFFDGLYHQRKSSSKISIDDGKTWDPLTIIDDEDCKIEKGCSLHVSYMASIESNGKLVTGPTPNILLAYGNKGKESGSVTDMGTYVSRDGGISWKFAFDGPAVFNFGDQGNIIVAVGFEKAKSNGYETYGPTDTLKYSLDQGKLWQSYKLDVPLYPLQVITTLDGTSTKFVVSGFTDEITDELLYAVDFKDAFGGKVCGDDDFETVLAREVPEHKEPICVYGHKEGFSRRKQDSKCLVNKVFEDVKVIDVPCECSDLDFECSPYFKLSDKGACVPDYSKIKEYCDSSKSKTVKLPHNQLISGNQCKYLKTSESDFVAESEFKCNELEEGDSDTQQIISQLSEIEGAISQYSYVSTNENLADNILLMTTEQVAYASNDGGKTFVRVPISEKLSYFIIGDVPGTVALVSSSSLYLSDDGANTFIKIDVPALPAVFIRPVSFDPQDPKKFIFFSGDQCGRSHMAGCTSYYTKDGGESFTKLLDNAVKCNYVSKSFELKEDLIYCSTSDGNLMKLESILDYSGGSKVLFDNILDYAVKPNFVLVATLTEDKKELRAKVTADGETFAAAEFPNDFKVEAQTAYTILESGSHSIFMHVTTDKLENHERGALLKSNSNGTSYVLSLNEVNRNTQGYVDYDRIETIEGVLIANTVNNPSSSEPKKLKTQISFNDGSQWSYLVPPAIDSEGKKYKCGGSSLAKCSLNLHGFTERPDFRDTFSSSSAVGVLIGVGNVGETLTSYHEAATFLSTDGGLTWKEIRKGVYMWEYGDRGTILVLVKAVEQTNEILYSVDDGASWKAFKFADEAVRILDLATVPTDTARKFIFFAAKENDKGHTLVYSVDFSHYYSRQCQIDLDNPLKDDFEYWTPRHPESSDNCLFGHETKYLRRAEGHDDCFIGAAPLVEGMKVVKNCTCTRRDYECDYNYYRDADGTCKLVKGLSPQDRKEQMCKTTDSFQYFIPTGYRKIPLSTCVGGKQFDSWNAQPCPGREKEFDEFYGRAVGKKWIFVVLIPLAVFLGATWFVYERGIRRNGGFQRFGQIRLDEDDDFQPIEDNTVDVVVNRIVRGGIIVVAGAVAVFKTARKIDRAMFERLTSGLFGRRPGQRSYVRVPDDDDELFGNFDENYEDELNGGADINFDVDDELEGYDDFIDSAPVDSDARLFEIDDDDRTQSQGTPAASSQSP